jgi:hypothetical protein
MNARVSFMLRAVGGLCRAWLRDACFVCEARLVDRAGDVLRVFAVRAGVACFAFLLAVLDVANALVPGSTSAQMRQDSSINRRKEFR